MNTVLFDLDGTLLPMEEDAFTKVYFKELCKMVAPLSIQPEPFVNAVWAGTKAMIMNDGEKSNYHRFWETFRTLIPCEWEEVCRVCDLFYANEFHRVKTATFPAPGVPEMVRMLRDKGYTVVLATNPVFPLVGVSTRLEWIGLETSDFDLLTSYENSRFCKPNPKYYQFILDTISRKPADCLMIGNNVQEDMCFEAMGGEVYLVTDHMDNKLGQPIKQYRQGSLADAVAMLNQLPSLH